MSSNKASLKTKDFIQNENEFIIEDDTYKLCSNTRSKILWAYRLFMIPFHIAFNLVVIDIYTINWYFRYMSYFSIGFNLLYFIFGFLAISVSRHRFKSLFNYLFKIWYSIAHPAAWIVTILYWGYIFRLVVPEYSWTPHVVCSIVGHIINLALLQLDLLLCTIKVRFKYFIWPLAIFILYESQMIYNTVVNGEKIPYQFLEENYNAPNGLQFWPVLFFLLQLNSVVVFFFWVTLKISILRDNLYSMSSNGGYMVLLPKRINGYGRFESTDTLMEPDETE